MTTLGSRLRLARERLGISQAELAVMARVDRHRVSKYETDSKAPSLAVLVRLCDALGVSADWLLGRLGAC